MIGPWSGNADNYETIVYEGYGPSGIAILVEAMTDNATEPHRNQALFRQVRAIWRHGCVFWSFIKRALSW
jgi:transcriptional/translational regulatory protein YebC/TACO1